MQSICISSAGYQQLLLLVRLGLPRFSLLGDTRRSAVCWCVSASLRLRALALLLLSRRVESLCSSRKPESIPRLCYSTIGRGATDREILSGPEMVRYAAERTLINGDLQCFPEPAEVMAPYKGCTFRDAATGHKPRQTATVPLVSAKGLLHLEYLDGSTTDVSGILVTNRY